MLVISKFAIGERVLCVWGSLLYEAVVIIKLVKPKTIEYYLHFPEWNNTWDEWVTENRLLKYNRENLQRKRELQIKMKRLMEDDSGCCSPLGMGHSYQVKRSADGSTSSKEVIVIKPKNCQSSTISNVMKREHKPLEINTKKYSI